MKKIKKTILSNEILVAEWAAGMGSTAIADKYGYNRGYIASRVAKLRKLGVKLARRPLGRPMLCRVDVDALNEVIASAEKCPLTTVTTLRTDREVVE